MIFVPASVTCIFSPEISEDPMKSGSIGVGFTINLGVIAKRAKRGVKFNDRDIEFPTVEYVMKKTGLEGVELESELPLGCGFGLSGASALATAFLTNSPALSLADLAHEAEVVNRTGLGDVVTQVFGGLVIRKNPSCPSKAIVVKFAWDYEFDFLVIDKISTKEILEDNLLRKNIKISGKNWTKEFIKRPTVENLFRCSNGFARETGLIEFVEDVIEAVQSENGFASMVMLGKAVFALKGFEVLKEFGNPFKARIDCCGVRYEGIRNSM